jgi:hypothetical protein
MGDPEKPVDGKGWIAKFAAEQESRRLVAKTVAMGEAKITGVLRSSRVVPLRGWRSDKKPKDEKPLDFDLDDDEIEQLMKAEGAKAKEADGAKADEPKAKAAEDEKVTTDGPWPRGTEALSDNSANGA